MLSPHLRLRHLRCFLETARLGSLSAAADTLHVSQPAASKTIRELENILDIELFDRSTRRLVLTSAGRLFQNHAGTAIQELERAQSLLKSPDPGAQRLSIGILPTAVSWLVPEAVLAFRAAHPDCMMQVTTGPNWLLLSQLREGSLDLVVGRMPPSNQTEGLSFRQLYWEHVVLVVRPDHPLLTGTEWGPGDLRAFPLMLPPIGAAISDAVRAWMHSEGLGDVTPAYESVSFAFGRAIVRHSETVWFISQGVVRQDVAAGALALLPLASGLLGGPVGISQREGARMTADVANLINALDLIAARAPDDRLCD